MNRSCYAVVFALLVTSLSGLGCATLEEFVQGESIRPEADVTGVRLTGLDENGLDVEFMIDVTNPNPISIDLAGLGYDVAIGGESLVSGKSDQAMTIGSRRTSEIALPVRWGFDELRSIAGQLASQDEIDYELGVDLLVELPLLGVQGVPIRSNGTLPVPKRPKIDVTSVDVQKIDLSGATVALQLDVENPNRFAVDLRRWDLDFAVNGQRWIESTIDQSRELTSGSKTRIEIPITLSFSELGRGVYELLRGKSRMNYELNGSLDWGADSPALSNVRIPINRSGQL